MRAGRPFLASQALPALTGARDELERGRPVEAHAALRGVHGLRHAEAEVPEIVAVAQRRVPVDRAVEPGIVGGARIGHHVRRRECDAVEGALGLVGIGARLGQHEGLEPAGVGGQIDLEGGEDGCVHRPCPCPRCERSAACSTRFARAARVPGSVARVFIGDQLWLVLPARAGLPFPRTVAASARGPLCRIVSARACHEKFVAPAHNLMTA